MLFRSEDTWDELASEVKRVVESSAEAMRNMEERHAQMQASLSSLNQRINALRKKYQEREETSRCEVCLRYFTKSLRATVFMQTVYSTVVRGYS